MNEAEGHSAKITGAWTKAGIASCIRVQGITKMDDLLFDCGITEPETLSAKFVFISHGHMDHVGSCISHARAKALSSASAKYFVSPEIAEFLNEARVAFEKMEGHGIPMAIETIVPGQTVQITSNWKVSAFATQHRVPSQGYALYSVKRGGLLPQYRGVSQEELKELKKNGVSVKAEDMDVLEMVYTGDTTFAGLLNPDISFIFQAPVLIMELTFLDGAREKSEQYGHVHIDDVKENIALFRNETVVFVHLSAKYSFDRSLKLLRDQLPGTFLRKCKVSLKSFGAGTHLTDAADVRWEQNERTTPGWGWAGRTANAFAYSATQSSASYEGYRGSGYDSSRNYRSAGQSQHPAQQQPYRHREWERSQFEINSRQVDGGSDGDRRYPGGKFIRQYDEPSQILKKQK